MKKISLLIAMILVPLCLMAQPGRGQGRGKMMDQERLEEMRETIRFIRLSESRKKLKFDEDKLLRVNEILDEMERVNFEMRAEEGKLRRTLRKSEAPEAERLEALEQLLAIKARVAENEIQSWAKLRELLTDGEALELYAFYDNFSSNVRRRLRAMSGGRSGDGPPRGRGRRQ